MSPSWWAFALAPASSALLAAFLWRQGLRGRLFVDALAIGVTLGAAVAYAEAPFDLKTNPLHFSPQTIAFLFAGWPEEGAKMLGVAAFLRAHFLARRRRDVVLAAGALSLGFAALENLFYIVNAGAGWASLAFDRALTATPFHVFEGLAGGFVVASVSRTPAGVALAIAAWLAIGAVHGVYDFAVFVGADGAAPPRLIVALGLDSKAALKTMLAAAEAMAALGAIVALTRLDPAPAKRAPPVDLALGAPLAIAATLALAGAALVSFVQEEWGPILGMSVFAVAPAALGALFVAGRRWPPLTLRWRRAFAALAALAVLCASAAAWRYGPGGWGQLTAMRFEARGAKLAARGDAEAAVEAYGRAVQAAPDRLDLRSQRAAVNVSLRRFDSALADIDAALRLAPELILLYKQRAEIDRQRNDPKAAIADLDAALLHKPNDPELLAMRAQAKIDAQDSQGAYRDLDAASHAAPDNPIVRRTFAAWDVDAGDFDAALRDLNARLYVDPNDAVASFQRGRVWLYKGDPARAVADLARADFDAASLYPALWRFLARARAREDGAAELLTRLAKAPNKWPAPVARMFVGLIDPAAARAAAGNADERCEADFYQVAWRRAREDRAAGADEWRATMQQCPTAFIEYEGAKAEWRRASR